MRKVLVLLFALTVIDAYTNESEMTASDKNRIILLPVKNLTDNSDYAYLKTTLYNVLQINLEKQERIYLLNNDRQEELDSGPSDNFDAYLDFLKETFSGVSLIVSEYYASGENLHILVNVWEIDTLRIKNSFIESMPADLDLLMNIENMAVNIAEAVARELPPTERDAIFDEQVAASLRQKINEEEQFSERIFDKHHELSITPFSGLSLGRTIVSWSEDGPFVSPVLAVGYTYLFGDSYRFHFGMEYLGFGLLGRETKRYEISFEAMFGFHTKSPFSLFVSGGFGASYDNNQASGALAYDSGYDIVYPAIERFSINLPIVLGFTIYFTEKYFISLGLNYHGINYTFEALDPEDYNIGNTRLKYVNGFSVWNFLCLSININTGLRF